jgi:3-deoxy-manno-octulosonate cytidylyltransferase (CMP-KDO synthetase)
MHHSTRACGSVKRQPLDLSHEFTLPPGRKIRYYLPPPKAGGASRHLPQEAVAMAQSRPAKTYVVIPARFASTRLPHKMLLRDTGKPLLQYTYEAACAAERAAAVLIATDHLEIAAAAKNFGAEVVMTSPDCQSGTDRVAEAARKLPDAEIVVNVQGDEPEISSTSIDRLIDLLERTPSAGMATLATPIRQPEQLANPACVKVVCDDAGRALYFSRSPIPFVRDPEFGKPFNQPPIFFQHLGLYAYRPAELQRFTTLPPSTLELAEKLEQLRLLQSGGIIAVDVVEHAASGIDTAADYAAFVSRMRKAG